MEEQKNGFMNYRLEVGKQLGTDDPVEQAILNILNHNLPLQETKDGLVLLHKIISNIQKNPSEAKFQTIKKDNPKLKQVLYPLKNLKEFLEIIGFVEQEDSFTILYFSDDIYDNIRKSSRSLDSYIQSFQVLQQGDPKLNKIVEERKKKFEEEKAYKQKLLDGFQANKEQVRKEHQTGQRQQQYKQTHQQTKGYTLAEH